VFEYYEVAMIFCNEYQKAISNLSWVDKGNLWIYDCCAGKQSHCRLYDANYLIITAGTAGYFSVVHLFSSKITVSVHHFREPGHVICKSTFNEFNTHVEGDLSFFKYVPQYNIAGFSINDQFEYNLIKISEGLIEIDNDRIKWYRHGNFDFPYQGLSRVTEFGEKLIFSVQRSGDPFLYDLKKLTLNRVPLANSGGNPEIIITKDGILASDYDTVLLFNSDWKVTRSKIFQDPADSCRQFIGGISQSSHHENIFTVPRPFSGDILVIDNTFSIKCICKTGRQPLEAVLINDRNIIARDWQTGDLIQGEIENLHGSI
jgi:hypothetical protein